MFRQSTNIGNDLYETLNSPSRSPISTDTQDCWRKERFPTWNNRALRVAMLPGQFGSSLWRLATGRHHAFDLAMVVTLFLWSGKVNRRQHGRERSNSKAETRQERPCFS